MKTLCRLLGLYAFLVVFLIVLFASALYYSSPTRTDVYSMLLSIAMFSLIPFGILFLLWKHHRH